MHICVEQLKCHLHFIVTADTILVSKCVIFSVETQRRFPDEEKASIKRTIGRLLNNEAKSYKKVNYVQEVR